MRSYLEILKELKKTLDADIIPNEDRSKIDDMLQQLLNLLWKYSY